MSCHDVVKKTMELYDAGRIGREEAKELIHECALDVNWCDGNRSEAIDYIRGCICSNCLKKVPECGKLYHVWDIAFQLRDGFKLFSAMHLASDGLCIDCFDTIVDEFSHEQGVGEKMRAFIEEQGDCCTSTGKYEDSNNGFWWPDDR